MTSYALDKSVTSGKMRSPRNINDLTLYTFQMGIQFKTKLKQMKYSLKDSIFLASLSCHYYPKSFIKKKQLIPYEN